ncbi:hypothetical protein [Salinisphaera sp.]|uniref:hypothetical protein n=1 Tax=Salinisphaera sp. TaxID=1914330 RepID=UPI000C584D39|nr:hypothetical protein [Salinisphaera sp.]MBS63626.1 hypothetical protein [Salinisphaera sp.]
MSYRALLFFALLASTSADSIASSETTSYIPQEKIDEFIVSTLDLASFRNSLGPRREPGDHTFADLGMEPTSRATDGVVFESNDWRYRIQVLERGDFNQDGIEDLKLCFQDRALDGSYNVQTPLLVSRYDSAGYLVALAFDLIETPGCNRIHE